MATQPPPVQDPRNATLAGPWRAVNFSTAQVPPPTPLYLQTEDQIQVNTFSPTVGTPFPINVEMRFLRPDGIIVPVRKQFQITSTSNPFNFTLGEGFLLSFTVSIAPGNLIYRGQLFVQAYVVRGIPTDLEYGWTLISDYVTTNYRPSWPGGTFKNAQEGIGYLRNFVAGNPAAGADFIITIPVGVYWTVLSVCATLTTAVAAANRQPNLIGDDGANILWQVPDTFQQTASSAFPWSWFSGAASEVSANSAIMHVLPNPAVMQFNYRIRSNTLALQAADQWSAIHALVYEYAVV